MTHTLLYSHTLLCWDNSIARVLCIVFTDRNACFFSFCFMLQIKHCTALYFNNDNARSHAACHTTQFLANSNVQTLPWPSMSPDLVKPKQTQLERVGETCLRQSECPCKCARVVSGPQAGLDGHPSANDLQPDLVHAWEMLSSYWFSRRTRSLLMCLSLSPKILSDQTFSRMSI